jgi:hypothetical protein
MLHAIHFHYSLSSSSVVVVFLVQSSITYKTIHPIQHETMAELLKSLNPWIEQAVSNSILSKKQASQKHLAQILQCHRSAADSFQLEISDGSHSIPVCIVNSQLAQEIKDMRFANNCMIRLEGYTIGLLETKTIGLPFCLFLTGSLQVVGAFGASVVGDPVPVRRGIKVRQALDAVEISEVRKRLEWKATVPTTRPAAKDQTPRKVLETRDVAVAGSNLSSPVAKGPVRAVPIGDVRTILLRKRKTRNDASEMEESIVTGSTTTAHLRKSPRHAPSIASRQDIESTATIASRTRSANASSGNHANDNNLQQEVADAISNDDSESEQPCTNMGISSMLATEESDDDVNEEPETQARDETTIQTRALIKSQNDCEPVDPILPELVMDRWRRLMGSANVKKAEPSRYRGEGIRRWLDAHSG